LGTIARHRAHDFLRRRREVPLQDNPDSSPCREVQPQTDEERNAQVQAALSTLPELHRAALTLRYFEAMDYATIERTLGLTNGALRGILGRALGAMRKRLRPALATLE
jgi:RNA polymerase sigma-70 factor (ECF subfamily)